MESATTSHPRSWNSTRLRDRMRTVPLPRPELAVLLALAALLYLWGLSKNGWANDYYSAAVRSMAGSWHDFLYGSFDAKGLMTVDKPPLALWVESLSVKAFGFNSLAILVPQALMGVASVGLLYDLVRRHFGRIAGATAGLALALTPVVVAISRHNNPDALLVLCSVGALWCFVRALEGGATKWLVAAAVCVGLGFEAKMGAALMVVPGMALAWLWVAPRGRAAAVKQLAIAGAALLAVALAWPVLVWLTPASSRPWISGTSDNSIWSLIWEYNGFGRLEGQTGGPSSFGGGGGGPFGGETGVFRLLNEALGGQAGWLLGAALVGGIGIAAMSRLRRTDPRTGWIIAVGGAFGVTAVAFSFAGGIFHPYYTSLLAPFAAALVGATVGQVLGAERRDASSGPRSATAFADARGPFGREAGGLGHGHAYSLGRGDGGADSRDSGRGLDGPVASRILGAAALGAGAIVELVVIDRSATDLGWLVVPLVLVSIAAACVLLFADQLASWADSRGMTPTRMRATALACGIGVLLLGPAIWSVDTLGHPTSGTFPVGGPESASMMGGPGGGGAPGGFGGSSSGGMGGMTGPGGAMGGPSGTNGQGIGPEEEGSESEAFRGGELPQTGEPPEGAESLGGGELPQSGAMPGMGEMPGGGTMPGAGESAEGGTMPGMPGTGSETGELPETGAMPGVGSQSLGGAESGESSGGTSATSGLPSTGTKGMTGGAMGGGPGGMFGGEDMTAIVEYTEEHGGGTIAVDSQSGAAASIIESGAEVAGIGGFSGKESSVSAEWLEERIESGAITWIYSSGLGGSMGGPTAMGGSETGSATEGALGGTTGEGATGESATRGFGPGGEGGSTSGGGRSGFGGGDTRTGSESAIDTVVKECTAVESSAYESGSATTSEAAGAGSSGGTLYKCGES
jgi:4-amino-4-deoxy-L-arabinose transferase-like glycosyltransferase